jgi:HD-like signal output (HDOD) protein
LELLKKSPLDPSSLVPIAALDPYLTLDLLILANSLSVDRENSVGTVPDAIERIGPRAATVIIDRLSSPDFPALPRNDPAARAVRRASLAAAVAAGRLAERYGITRERGYTLGLLHCIAYSDLFEIVREMNLPAGPFRGAVLETYRPAVGRSRAEIWGLPRDFEAVLSDDGTDPSAAAAVVRIARSAVAGCAIGGVPVERADDLDSDELTDEVNMLFEYLGLETVAAARD